MKMENLENAYYNLKRTVWLNSAQVRVKYKVGRFKINDNIIKQ